MHRGHRRTVQGSDSDYVVEEIRWIGRKCLRKAARCPTPPTDDRQARHMGMNRSLDHPRDILRAAGVRPRHALGQNFLVSPQNLDRIVEAARIESDDVVLEIGTGLGTLTARLSARAHAVVSVEIDERLYRTACSRLAESRNVKLICADFLASKHRINPEVEAAVLGCRGERRVKVVANLPYQISSPAVVNLLEWKVPLAEIDVMLQLEVSERITACPGEAAYGPLTVFCTYHAEAERLFTLPPSAFWPRPAVSSSFLRITPCLPKHHAEDYQVFSEVVNRLLQSRRKTLARAFEVAWGRAEARLVLEKLRLDPALRPGELAVADFVRIANVFTSYGAEQATPP